ncbi:putative MFS family arabinose efflux permease [Sphingobacterium alimentarium]|uniref:Putative MFS family arabinose efflux permease n=1 Tax=Sphingobacterium alimentarium TaxID=797292 RepID=A0A4R3W039_9SPHI|nr:MFS transporter [Sphingobacterium alimentarium]TCV20708.1 putative MFS family arabinose efflux permease [Sphingobacterium alimentarium]
MSTETQQTKGIWKVIGASSLGTLIEWYDFFIFGSLSIVISTKFFPADNPTAAFLSTLATFAAGFVVRPFGALFFGRLGDLIGRKYTFMVTLMLMGGATFLIGCIPSYESIGFWAPILVLILRLLQGLALGGEYGGAATYVAEHSPKGQRGYWTSWIQTTATFGLFISLLVILLTRSLMDEAQFDSWGWRVPFLLSIFMVYVSYLIRKNMDESPEFKQAKTEGKTSKNPLKESFGNKYNLKFVLLALFGAAMGQGVVWYTGQFYSMSFMKTVMHLHTDQADVVLGIALLCGTPFFIVFGWLSDKVGRKWVMLTGMALAILTYRPIYEQMYQLTNVANKEEITAQKEESFEEVNNEQQKDELITHKSYYTDGTVVTTTQVKQTVDHPTPTVKQTVIISGINYIKLILLIFIQIIYITLVYGPIAAFLVEIFPVKIRYTSMSLPYHIGNGVFGGLLPAVSTYLATNAQTMQDAEFYLAGLWYPIIISAVCFVIGALYINKNIYAKNQ